MTSKISEPSTASHAAARPTSLRDQADRPVRHAFLPNLVVLGVLAGIAWLGHSTNWTFGFRHRNVESDSSSATWETIVEPADVTHQTRQCIHGLPRCPHCEPDLAQTDEVPTIDPQELSRIQRALEIRPREKIEPPAIPLPKSIRVHSAESSVLDVAPVWRSPITETLDASGELTFDPARVARLTARVSGSAWRVLKQTGDTVMAGEIVALIDSAEIAKIKADLQQAIVQVRLKRNSVNNIENSPVAERRKREAKSEWREAENRMLSVEQTLVNLGFDIRSKDLLPLAPDEVSRHLQSLGVPRDDQRGGIGAATTDAIPGSLLPIRAPFDGVILESNVIPGEFVTSDQVVFNIVDPRELWLSLWVPSADLDLIRLDQEVRFRPDGSSRTVTGRISWIGSTAEEHTRRVPVRVTVPNSDGALRAHSLGKGQIVLRVDPDAIVVPENAVQKLEDASLVFVRDKRFLKPDGPKAFYPRWVITGAKEGTDIEIIAGVFPGEIVATQGSRGLLNAVTIDLQVK